MAEKYTVAEVAEKLGVSARTIRRRIANGELPAIFEDGPYGRQYFVDGEQVRSAEHIIDVVKVERANDPRAIALAIVQGFEMQMKDKMLVTSDHLDRLEKQVGDALLDREKAVARAEEAQREAQKRLDRIEKGIADLAAALEKKQRPFWIRVWELVKGGK